MNVQLTIELTGEDLLNLERLRVRWPRWTENMIIRKALAVYANQQPQRQPLTSLAPHSAQQDIADLYGS